MVLSDNVDGRGGRLSIWVDFAFTAKARDNLVPPLFPHNVPLGLTTKPGHNPREVICGDLLASLGIANISVWVSFGGRERKYSFVVVVHPWVSWRLRTGHCFLGIRPGPWHEVADEADQKADVTAVRGVLRHVLVECAVRRCGGGGVAQGRTPRRLTGGPLLGTLNIYTGYIWVV